MIIVKILLKQVRHDKQLTLKQLERLSGVSDTHISEIENGIKTPTIQVLCRLARGLSVPVTNLFVDTNGIQGAVKH